MAVEHKIRDRILALAEEGKRLAPGDDYGHVRDQAHADACVAWIGAANNVLALACPSPTHSYRQSGDWITDKWRGINANRGVGGVAALFNQLMIDIDQGMLASVADQARAETFDDLLDHAREYHTQGRLDGSAILATAVFEDTLRRICRTNSIPDKDVRIDTLITTLDQGGFITSVVAKRCRAAAGARNKALHAQWDEITLQDVEMVIALTRELLTAHLR
jgi:hypothetical protein